MIKSMVSLREDDAAVAAADMVAGESEVATSECSQDWCNRSGCGIMWGGEQIDKYSHRADDGQT